MNFFPITMSAAIVIAACVATGPTRISHSTIDRGYRLSEVALAGASGSLPVIITGDPFGIGSERFEAAVTDAMQGHHFGPPTEFVAVSDEGRPPHYRVVMIFDAPLSLGGRAVCGHSISLQPAATPAAPLPDQPSYVIAAFCREDVPLTQLAGVMARTGVDDPVFRNFIGLVTLRLFPAFNPEARPDHDREPVIPEP